jgi:flagellar biosynthesis component FlhA
MSSVSLFEQLTSSVSLSMLAIVSGAILTLLLVYTVGCRLFFSSSNKDKKSNTKKQQGNDTTSNKKKNSKTKKNVVTVSSSSPNTQSEESEHEKAKVLKKFQY